jgi:hypothetical protein
MNALLYDLDLAGYVTAVLNLYLGLPETPLRASAQDRKLARQLHQRGVALRVVESACLLASVRRLARQRTFLPSRPFVLWPTSNPLLRNCFPIPHQKIMWNTSGSNCNNWRKVSPTQRPSRQ